MLRVFGQGGTAELFIDHLVVVDRKQREKRYDARKSSFVAEFEHFADVVQYGRPLAVSPSDALGDLALVEAVARPPRWT
jgi:predicted dehydrogenase